MIALGQHLLFAGCQGSIVLTDCSSGHHTEEFQAHQDMEIIDLKVMGDILFSLAAEEGDSFGSGNAELKVPFTPCVTMPFTYLICWRC